PFSSRSSPSSSPSNAATPSRSSTGPSSRCSGVSGLSTMSGAFALRGRPGRALALARCAFWPRTLTDRFLERRHEVDHTAASRARRLLDILKHAPPPRLALLLDHRMQLIDIAIMDLCRLEGGCLLADKRRRQLQQVRLRLDI